MPKRYGPLSFLFSLVLFAAVCVASLVVRSGVAQQASATQVLRGTAVTWRVPGTGWKTYDHAMLRRLGVDADECIQNADLKATLCVKVLDVRKAVSPSNAVDTLFRKFGVDPADRPRVDVVGTRASFVFSMESGIVMDAMDIKVTADVAPGRPDRILMVMGAWNTGTSGFSARDFDVVAAQVRLR